MSLSKNLPLWLAATLCWMTLSCVDNNNGPFFPDNGGGGNFTIQSAIDFAQPGDTIYLDVGTYSASTNGENFPLFLKDGVNIVGKDPQLVILDAQNFGPVLNIFNYSGTIQNLTLQNGLSNRGGGIVVQNSNPNLQNLYVINNRASLQGTGIYIETSNGTTVQNVVLQGNVNDAASSTSNPAQVEVVNSSINFVNNVVAQGDSDGLRLTDGSSGTIENNIFFANGTNGFGTGMADTDANTAADIQFNICNGNAEADFFLNGMDLTAQQANDLAPADQVANNFNADPLFNNPSVGDFTLQAGSPAIQAGDPAPGFNNPDGSRNDIGAFGGPGAQGF